MALYVLMCGETDSHSLPFLSLTPCFQNFPGASCLFIFPHELSNQQVELKKKNSVFVFNRIVHIYKLERIIIFMLSSIQERTVSFHLSRPSFCLSVTLQNFLRVELAYFLLSLFLVFYIL